MGEIWSKRQQHSLTREPPTLLILFLLTSVFLLPASKHKRPRSHTWLESTAFVNVGETSSRQDSKKHGNMGTAQKINRSLPWLHVAKSSALKTYLLRLAMNRSGNFTGMCRNCLSYVYFCVLRKHPTWRVCDVYTRNIFLPIGCSLTASQVRDRP